MERISDEMLKVIEANHKEFYKYGRSTSQTLHIICAGCGADNKVSNYVSSDGTITIDSLGIVSFNCQYCKSAAVIPAQLIGMKKGD